MCASLSSINNQCVIFVQLSRVPFTKNKQDLILLVLMKNEHGSCEEKNNNYVRYLDLTHFSFFYLS